MIRRLSRAPAACQDVFIGLHDAKAANNRQYCTTGDGVVSGFRGRRSGN